MKRADLVAYEKALADWRHKHSVFAEQNPHPEPPWLPPPPSGFWFTEHGMLDFGKWRAVHLLAAVALTVLASYLAPLPSYALVAFAWWQMGKNWNQARGDLSWRAPWRFFL